MTQQHALADDYFTFVASFASKAAGAEMDRC
jgi:hypothetical protein